MLSRTHRRWKQGEEYIGGLARHRAHKVKVERRGRIFERTGECDGVVVVFVGYGGILPRLDVDLRHDQRGIDCT